jgi:hypothetical protein
MARDDSSSSGGGWNREVAVPIRMEEKRRDSNTNPTS